MNTNRIAKSLVIALLLAAGAGAQEANPGLELVKPFVGDTAPPAEDRILWQLQGGGELVGRVTKETPDSVFVDIGPEIVRIPASSIVKRTPLADAMKAAAESASAKAGGSGSGVFDPATGTLVFRGGQGAELRSVTETINNAKRSVVLVSNSRGLGTGWVLDNEGRIVTNHHVVGNEKFQAVTVFIPQANGQYERRKIDDCEVEAFSSLLDIAIVKVDPAKAAEKKIQLEPLSIAAPGSLQPGDRVFAVGNPGMGRMVLEQTVSEGIVSNLARNFSDVIYVQTTAAVNPGNSGGPLLNERGEVVGLITLKASFQEGIAFALPSAWILQFVQNQRSYAFSEMNRNRGVRYLTPE